MFPVAVLAGGLATRLRPLTETIPKALVAANGEPFIAHQLRLLKKRGIRQVVVCAGHLGHMIEKYVGDGSAFGLRIDFSFDGPVLLGTAGAIKKALPLLGTHFFVLYGDSYLPCDYRGVQAEFAKAGRPALMTVFRNADRWDKSNVEFSDGCILAYNKEVRTHRMRYIDCGLGLFKRAAFHLVPDNTHYDLAALYQALLKQGELAGYEVHDRFYEVGSFDGLKELSDFLGQCPC